MRHGLCVAQGAQHEAQVHISHAIRCIAQTCWCWLDGEVFFLCSRFSLHMWPHHAQESGRRIWFVEGLGVHASMYAFGRVFCAVQLTMLGWPREDCWRWLCTVGGMPARCTEECSVQEERRVGVQRVV